MAPKPRTRSRDELRQLLADRGIRVTTQRMALLTELAHAKRAVSHPELTDRIGSATLDRATIYRNLVSLSEAGLLVRSQLGDGVWRYELPRTDAREHGNHPHFVCTRCGDITCLSEGSVAIRGDAAKNDVSEVQLRGRCTDCVRASA